MQLKIKSLPDFWAGLIFIGLGILAIYLSWDYPMGSALRMGPGYFPTWLGGIMMGFGVVIMLLSFKMELEGDVAHTPWGFRPWLVLSGTLFVYAFLMEKEVGFIPSLMVLIIGCALAHKDVHWYETALLSIFVTLGAVGLFIYIIGLPYRLFWWSY